MPRITGRKKQSDEGAAVFWYLWLALLALTLLVTRPLLPEHDSSPLLKV
jgi:hypothetical protein